MIQTNRDKFLNQNNRSTMKICLTLQSLLSNLADWNTSSAPCSKLYTTSSSFLPLFLYHAMQSRTGFNAYLQPFAHTNSFLHSFVPSAISLWNSLPSNVTSILTLPIFKTYIHALNLFSQFVNRIHLFQLLSATAVSIALQH